MKKIISTSIFLIVSLLFFSCNNENFSTSNDSNGYKSVCNLKNYNDSILKTRMITRGPTRDLQVAFADCTGAASGVSFGHKLGLGLGAISGGTGYFISTIGCGTIWGAICSYMAMNVSQGNNDNSQKINDFLNLSKDIVVNNIKIVPNGQAISTIRNWKTTTPSNMVSINDEYVNKIGTAHNNLLDKQIKIDQKVLDQMTVAKVCKIPEIRATKEDSIIFNQIINSDEFNNSYFQTANSIQKCFTNGIFDIEKFFKENPLQSKKIENALKLYGELYTTYPQDTEDIEKITTDYIKIIEQSEEFTDEEKDIIYSAFNVSIYSPQFWNEFK